MITVCFIKRKGINGHFCHFKFHCLYDVSATEDVRAVP